MEVSRATLCRGCQSQKNIVRTREADVMNSPGSSVPIRVPVGMSRHFIWILTTLWLCVTHSYAAVAPPFITLHPEGDTSVQGNVEVLRCNAIGGSPLQYRWWKDGVEVPAVVSNNYRIPDIAKSHAGEYRCVVVNPVGTIISKVADVDVAHIGLFPPSGTSLQMMAGQAAIINCPPIDSNPLPEISWSKDSAPLSASERVVPTLNGRLVIIDIMSSDAGSYVCHAVNTVSAYPADSQPIQFIVTSPSTPVMAIPPSVIVPPQDVIVYEGESLAQMECIVSARPLEDLEITWVRGGEVYRTGGLELFKLQIRSPQMSDQGTYECRASLNGVTVTASADLTYYTIPTFITSPEVNTVSPVGSTVVVPCQAAGSPAPSIVWYRNAVDVTKMGDSRYQVLSTGSLQIRDLQKPDAAMLQCRIFNEVDEDIRDTLLVVKEIAPEFIVYPNNTILLVGESALLECQASGAPIPTIRWYKDGNPVASEESTLNFRYIFESGNLRVNDAETADSGLYLCEASNTKGAINRTINFDVYERTYIAKRPMDIEKILDNSTVLDCEVYSDSRIAPSVVWYHDGQVVDITDGNIMLLASGSLDITRISSDDAGSYVCRVTSVAGDDEASAELSVIRLPFQPLGLQARISLSDSRTISLTWVAPFNGNTPLLRYIIDQKEDLSSFRETESTVDPAVTSFDVVGVKPSRSYQFRIRAENKVGTGLSSQPSLVVTLPEEAPDDPPQRVVASASSTDSIIVEWQEPPEDTWNGDLLGYMVQHRLYNYPNAWSTMDISNVRQTSVVLTDLLTWQRYEIRVAAYNRAGTGTYSNSLQEQTLEGVPTEPPRNVDIRVVNSTAILFNWSPPSQVAINGINQGYKLHLWEPDMEDDKMEIIVPSNPGATSYSETVGGLMKYTQYVVTILCYTRPGNGPTSTPRTMRTSQDIPGPVQNLRVANVQATSLTLEWDQPTEENGVLTKYWVEYFPVNDTDNAVSSELEPETNHLHITQLMSQTTYSFSVWAETSVGAGDRQMTSIKSGIPPVVPESPTTTAVSDVQTRSVNLHFTPGFDGHASISLWTVEALVGTDAEWTTVFTISAPEANHFVITGLRPHTTYTFRMIATNIAGDSEPSEVSNSIETGADIPEIAPSEVSVRAVGAQSLRVRWVPLAETDWNGVAIGYVIDWSRVDNPSALPGTHSLQDPYGSEYIITGLEEYTAYQVTVLATNNVGDGPISLPSTRWTHEAVPSADPEGLTASVISDSSIEVAWGEIPSQDRNGIILGYRVFYQDADDLMADEMVQDVEGNDTKTATLSGLKGFSSYTIMVVGRTRIGFGIPHEEVTARTLQSVPGPPTEIEFSGVTETNAIVQWSLPIEPNGVISQYQIAYKVRGASQIINTHTSNEPEVRKYMVSGLQANTYYTFTITAGNDEGLGSPASADVYTTTDRDKPDPPSNLNINHVKSRQVTLSWTPGNDNNAPIRSYRIRLRNMDGGSWMDHPSSIPHDALSYTVTGLKPYLDYQFRIQAMNDKGLSPFSERSEYVRTQEDIPEGAPIIVNVKPVTTTSVQINWRAPEPQTHNGDLLGFRVVIRQLSENTVSERIVSDPLDTSYTLDNLIKYEKYEITMTAFNSIGDGPSSPPSSVYVGEAAPSAAPSGVTLRIDSANTIRVTWSPPPADSLNGGLQGYKVTYWPSHARKRSPAMVTRAYASTATDVVLDGLKCATTYSIQVMGFNGAGDGPASDAVTATTDEDVPGEVAFLAFDKIRSSSLVVSWGAPPMSCGMITFYKLSYQPLRTVNGEKSSITTDIAATKTEYHVMELDPKVPYTFTISARTSSKAQFGPVVEKNITTGPQRGAPMPPRDVGLEIMSDELTISWEEPADNGNSPLTGYFVEYQAKDEDWMLLADEIPASQRYHTFMYQDLKSSTVYSFRVSAENSQSSSEPGYYPETLDTSLIHYTGPQVAFYEEAWFLVIVALVGVIIILLVCGTLCMLGRSKLYREKKKSKRVNHVHHPASTDDGGFQPMEMNPTKKVPRNGNYTSTNSYRRMKKLRTRPPPKPSPGSVQYSEEEESKHYEPVAKREVGETASLTERYPESVNESESESEHREEVGDSFVKHYASLPPNQDWRQQAAPQAYSYTDSEPDHNSVAMYNNGLVNMEAGSRNPIQGFSSFV